MILEKSFFELNADGSYYFKGSYMGSRGFFMGLTVADAYLNAIEALIRIDRIEESKTYLSTFLKNRYTDGHVPALANKNKDQILKFVLDERRKEFVMRDSRWSDIKRLNKVDGDKIIPTRMLSGEKMVLQANDNRYALPLPAEIIEITGMLQNPR
ncbi:RagB/SusD family nutrient uptake outer membrane protein [Sphingobacterium sp. KU25419]|nr:RagB/SusD family nutrient uptake outer membrane protein [Sphingobacterium sp. KU25419]